MKVPKTFTILLFVAGLILFTRLVAILPGDNQKSAVVSDIYWIAPDTSLIPYTAQGDLIRYGRNLVANTSYYLGPHGTVAQISNGMNCQNCHLEAGAKFWGNNYGGVYSTYPKFRDRSGSIETVYRRINDCIERSLNGKSLDTSGKEIKAIYAYMKWLGRSIPRKVKPIGTGIADLPFLDRAADPQKGQQIYIAKCKRCHGADGQGQLNTDSLSYLYPPLWGDHSYNIGAGLFRISRFAGYVRDNMPFGASHEETQLTNQEAWDVAAFVNSQPRPIKEFDTDWPDISKKPFDHPFGPYNDRFTEEQHKYGPFNPIKKAREELSNKQKSTALK